MACCGAGAVLRTSKLGTRHFAHARRGPCETAPETAEHLLAKMAVIDAVEGTEWDAIPEQAGSTPTGHQWRADVLAVKGNARVAIEIQWSRQDTDETERRQSRYAEAGVRGLWLFRQKNFPSRKDIPSFRLMFDERAGLFNVLIPSAYYDPKWVSISKDDDLLWSQTIPLQTFIKGALKGRLRFAPTLGCRMPVDVDIARIRCWRCKKETGVVAGLTFAASRIFPRFDDFHTSIHDMAKMPDGVAEVMSILPPSVLMRHGIGVVKPRSSKAASETYLSNGCVHCDALQGRFFESAFEAQTEFATEAVFKPEWVRALPSATAYTYRWWFDEGRFPQRSSASLQDTYRQD
nr:competence protein CoiA family protein [Caballeronia sp. Lep1P3]